MDANLWNELPFPSGMTRGGPQYLRGNLPHIFMGDGKEDFSRWCRRFEVIVAANPNYEEVSLAKLLPTCLGGVAFSYWDSLAEETKLDYKVVKDKLKAVFGQAVFLSTFQSYVNARTRLPGEAASLRKLFLHMKRMPRREKNSDALLRGLNRIYSCAVTSKA